MANDLTCLDLPHRPKPRKTGLTVLFDYFLSLSEVDSMLETSKEALDYSKFIHAGLGLGETMPDSWYEQKTERYRDADIKTYPGGVPYQIALVQDKVDEYFKWVKEKGFDGLEIAEDAMSFEVLTAETRKDHIKQVLDMGLFVDTEFGKKDPLAPLDLNEAYDMIMSDLELGVSHVVIERAELNHFMDTDPAPLVEMCQRIGMENLLFEPGPFGWPDVHQWCFKVFGPDLNLSNIEKPELLYVEFSRRGLSRFDYSYFDQFKPEGSNA